MSEFVDYNELYNILNEKIGATHDELHVWARQHRNHHIRDIKNFFINDNPHDLLIPFVSDLPDIDRNYIPVLNKFDPMLCFYLERMVTSFDPPKHSRLVYIKDLSAKRNWPQYSRRDIEENAKKQNDEYREKTMFSIFPALDRASKNGIIRFYDKETYQFSYYQISKSNNSSMDKLWIETAIGEEYVAENHSFFLLQDIINVERIFFNRSRKECLEELGFNPKDYE